MSEFSTTLKKYLEEKDIKIKQLAINTGIERTFLQKIIAGNRMPKDINMVRSILFSMMLSPREYEELIQLYMIAHLGKENYQRNLLVKKFFETFNAFSDIVEPSFKLDFSIDLKEMKNLTAISGKDKIYWSLKALIEKECSDSVNEIKVIMQPKNRLYNTMLFLLGKINNNLKIEHIICMENNVKKDNDNDYNLGSLKSTVPFIIHRNNYEIFVYYNDVFSRFDKTEMFPNLFVFGKYVVTVSHDYNNAIIYINEEAFKLYSDFFEELKKITKPLITTFSDIYDYIEFYGEKEKENKSLSIDLMAQPCFGFFVNEDFVKKNLAVPLERIRSLLDSYYKRIERFERYLDQGNSAKLFFTKSGMERFINEGKIDEFDPKLYYPLEMKDRIIILKKFLRYINEGKFYAYFINTSKFDFDENLVVSAIDEHDVTLIYSKLNSESVFFKINEQSLVYSMFMFLEDLNESENIIHEESVAEYLERRIGELDHIK